jgi:hypothetical protein
VMRSRMEKAKRDEILFDVTTVSHACPREPARGRRPRS